VQTAAEQSPVYDESRDGQDESEQDAGTTQPSLQNAEIVDVECLGLFGDRPGLDRRAPAPSLLRRSPATEGRGDRVAQPAPSQARRREQRADVAVRPGPATPASPAGRDRAGMGQLGSKPADLVGCAAGTP
jgi:hypothetical protein